MSAIFTRGDIINFIIIIIIIIIKTYIWAPIKYKYDSSPYLKLEINTWLKYISFLLFYYQVSLPESLARIPLGRSL